MQLNAEQEQAVKMAENLAKMPRRVGILAGPAGTGKTTSLRAICDRIGDVVMLSPTGRAALRASKLSGRPASTIHSYLYKPYEEDGVLRFQRRMDLQRPSSGVIIVDESSMLGFDVASDLWPVMQEIDCSMLFVGDSFQLPPVTKDGEDEFSVFGGSFKELVQAEEYGFERVDLKTVQRQALDSPILRAATDMRNNPTDWPLILDVLQRDDFPKPRNVPVRLAAMVEDGIDHACITYTNATRNWMNREVRKLRGLTDEDDPQPGEPLLIRKNCRGVNVFNGEIIKFGGFIDLGLKGIPKQFRFTKVNDITCMMSRDGIIDDVQPDYNVLRGLKWPFVQANLGYAMTCHASQGSEFDWVVLYWDRSIVNMPMPYRTRWLYTALTRAKEKLIIGGLS